MNKPVSAFGGKKLLFMFPIVALLAAGCSSSQQASNQPPVQTLAVQNVTPTSTPSPTPTISEPSVQNWQVYTNTDYGFQLTFPLDWKGYRVVKRPTDVVNFGAMVYDVKLSTTDKNYGNGHEATPLVIIVNTKAQWDELLKQDGPKTTKIAANSKYVFSYATWQDAPEDLYPLGKEFAQIIASFKFTK